MHLHDAKCQHFVELCNLELEVRQSFVLHAAKQDIQVADLTQRRHEMRTREQRAYAARRPDPLLEEGTMGAAGSRERRFDERGDRHRGPFDLFWPGASGLLLGDNPSYRRGRQLVPCAVFIALASGTADYQDAAARLIEWR